MPERLRVLIADDHRMFAEALQAILAHEAGVEVVGSAGDGHEAVERARELRPDVVLMDIAMPGMDGIAATRAISDELAGETSVLILTGSDSSADVARARDAGAAGYVTKDQIAEELVRAILGTARR